MRIDAAALAALIPLAGCVADDRVLLEQCAHGLYWADCGGDGEMLLGCDEATGDCRWFSGGVTARGHAVSDCPATDVCCHEGWPFEDFRPDGDLLRRVTDQMGYVPDPVTRDGNTVSVAFDLDGETTSGRIYNCEGSGIAGCAVGNLGTPATLRREGSSVVASMGRDSRLEIEILPGTPWRARLYQVLARTPREGPPVPICRTWSLGGPVEIEGELHLTSDDLTDLDALHGRLDASDVNGSYSIEF